MPKKKKFWRGFTWRRFLLHLATYFGFLFIADIIFSWDDINGEDSPFKVENILKYIFLSLLMAFFFTLWSDPAEKEETDE